MTLMASAMSADCHGLNGVIHQRPAPIAVALATPPMSPSRVFDGETSGAILCLPKSFPQMYCSTSLDWTTSTRNTMSSRLRPSKPGMFRVSSAGTCEMQNTQTINPHWTLAARSRKRMVSPDSAERIGRTRNAYTGMKMEYKPYQPPDTSTPSQHSTV